MQEKNEKVYSLLRYGVNVSPDVGTKKITVNLIDWEHPDKNQFYIAEEVTINSSTPDSFTKRPDLVIYVNGIALAVMELKRSKVSVHDGIRQTIGNQQENFIRPFFSTVQLLFAGNDSQGLYYGVIDTPEKFWLRWKEPDASIPNELDRGVTQWFNKERLLEMIHDFLVFDAGVKKVCRPNQYFAVKAAQPRCEKKEGGVIWEAQGSGKSLIMVWLAEWIHENIDNSRVVIITDREELDEQISDGFKDTGETIARAKSGAGLIGMLNEEAPWLLCTLIHKFGKKNVATMDAEAVKNALLEAGLFAFIRQRPYDIIADPTVTPKGIFVSAFDTNPLAPDFEFALKGEEANFQTGLDALAKLAKTYLSISVKQNAAALTQAKNVTITAFDGPNPAGNVGVQINHLDPVSKGETVWTIDPQAVIFIGRLFNTGRVDFTRTVAVTGSEVLKPAYCKLQVGALLTNVFAGNVTKDKDLRYISGNVLTGKQVSPNGFLGAFHSQLTVIPEGDDIHEMLGWIMPRFNQFSANRSYFSWLMGKKEYTLDARVKGGERHMIMSGEYDKVFPMDILPEYLIKAIIAGDIDRMEALGIYEVAPEDFALCEFVCSSKMELQRIVRAGLDMLRAEMA